jgi:hypothetical protein
MDGFVNVTRFTTLASAWLAFAVAVLLRGSGEHRGRRLCPGDPSLC